MRAQLTETAVRQAKPRDRKFKLFDQGGLFLLVTPQGSKLWRYKYRIGTREGLLSIGRYPDIGIAKARELHRFARGLVAEGIDPSAKKKADRLAKLSDAENTFKAVATQWIDWKRLTKSSGYIKTIESTLARDVFPFIGSLPIKQVTTPHLFEILQQVQKRSASKVAVQIRGWCFAIFRFAIQRGLVQQNLAEELADAIQIAPVEHRAKLDDEQLSILLKQLSASKSSETVILALRLLALTFVRPGELRNACWSEFDLEKRVWVIPAERMKMRIEHRVPLSNQALEILDKLKRTNQFNRPQLFPNMRDPRRNMSMTTLNRVLERLGWGGKFSSHGFRATASSYFNDHKKRYRPDAIERQLAHRETNQSRRPYNQAQYWHERTTIMQDWADHLDELQSVADVVP